jgi:hypothetical protein
MVLGAIALLTVVFAVLALWQQAESLAPKYTPELFFPKLKDQVTSIQSIHIVSKKTGTVDIALTANGDWVLPGRNSYPASMEEIKKTVVALAYLEKLEPKTNRADWLHRVGLDDPAKGGDGTLFAFLDDKGKTIASIILGKSQDIGDPSGAVGIFARDPNSTQVWLTKSVVELSGDPSAWVAKDVLNIDRSRIQETDITPESGPAYVARRNAPSDAEFSLVPLPKGRELADPSAASGVAAAIVGFTFDDVKAEGGFDFSKPARVVTKTFDGLAVTTQIIQEGPDYWAAISAEAAPGKADAAKEAAQINARTHGWAYKLPAYKGQLFTTALERLLKPVAPAAPKK